jgi:phosphate transport system permease protein
MNAIVPIATSPREPTATDRLEGRRSHRLGDLFFHGLVGCCALVVLGLIVGFFVELGCDSRLALGHQGLGLLTNTRWDPVHEHFGGLSSIYGTVVSSAIAMLIAAPLSLGIALFLVEMAPPWLAAGVGGAIELLAAVPSIIFGMWGLFVLAPFMAEHVQPALDRYTGGLPLFTGPPMGVGMLTAGLVLALMVLPFVSQVTLPFGFRGVLAAMFLGLSRALGETMAVTFVIGNAHRISASLFEPSSTISATLANEFAEATEPVYLSALVALGLVLLVISLLVQIAAQLWLRRVARQAEGR